MAGKKIEVIVSDLPSTVGGEREYISGDQKQKFDRDIRKLIDGGAGTYHGRAWNQKNGAVYQIFAVDDKQVLVEDPNGTAILKSMFDTDGRLREVEIKE